MKSWAWSVAVAAVMPGLLVANELSGKVSLGYRNVSVNGDDPKYSEDVNLDDGPRLFRAEVTYRPEDAAGNAPDIVDVELSGLGGDPFERARLDVRKYGSWSFSAERRRSDYEYADILVLPENASVSSSTGGDFHHYDFERVRDDVSLEVNLNERASMSLGFERYGRHGESTTTLDISRDEFELEKPIDEEMRLFRGTFRYRWDKVAVSFEERLRDFKSDSTIFLAGFSEGENSADLTTLDRFFLDQPYELSGHEHVLRVETWPGDRVELGFAVAIGNVDMTTSASEESQGVGFTGSPFDIDASGAGGADRDTSLFDIDLSFAVNDRVGLTAGAARRRFEQSASMTFSGMGGGASDWDIGVTSFEAGVQYAASRDLTISAGWYGDRRDVEANTIPAGEEQVPADVDTDSGGFYASVDYRPGERFSVSASLNDTDIDDPFALAAPTESTRYRVRARYAFDSGLALIGSHSRTDAGNAPSGWSSDIRQTTLRVAYASGRWALSAGISDYDGARQVDRIVTGGTRQDLLAIAWNSDTKSADLSITCDLAEHWTVGGAFRRYANDGSLEVNRDDFSVFADWRLPDNYSLRLNLRDIEYDEGAIEWYDAGIVELALGLAF